MNGSPSAEPRLEARGLSLHDGERFFIEKVGLTLRAGEVLAVTGPGGAGKSLLLRALAGLAPAGLRQEGWVRASGRVALAVASPALAPALPLGRQFTDLLHATLGLDRDAALAQAAKALDRMGAPGSPTLLGTPPASLTEALRWRAALALALAGRPAVLLADAPAAALDPTLRAEMLCRLADWARDSGTALLLAGRAEDGMAGPADRRLSLDRGRADGPGNSRHPGARAGARAGEQAGVRAAPRPAGPPVLSVRDLSVGFPMGGGQRLTVVEGVSFGLAWGETLALLGETGSGKSVLARALARLVPVTGGRATWMGQDLATLGERAVRRDLQLLFPQPAAALDPLVTIGTQVTQALKRLRPDIPAAGRPAMAERALARAGVLPALAGLYPAGLDAGEAARAGLARALAAEPRLLIGDEPAGSLSGASREDFFARLTALQEEGVSLILATQDAESGLRLAHRAMVMAGGRVVEAADAALLTKGSRHHYSRALVAAARGQRPDLMPGEPPTALRADTGCVVRARCPAARRACTEAPTLEEVAPGHWVACHFPADAP